MGIGAARPSVCGAGPGYGQGQAWARGIHRRGAGAVLGPGLPSAETLAEVFRRLAFAAIDDEIELQARQAIGLCLGRLGDPRIRGLRDPLAYVEVAAGTYLYGDKKQTVVPFRLGRYPVTNCQFQDFLEDGGYEKQQWWSDAGWAWLQSEGVTEPARWRDGRWNGPNQPVVGVSFWEAEACSKWAGGRLPQEQEWEAAARGVRGSVYPWGKHWVDGIVIPRRPAWALPRGSGCPRFAAT